jgi:3-oxoacyl-[acyl-carrier-protein] synthase-3
LTIDIYDNLSLRLKQLFRRQFSAKARSGLTDVKKVLIHQANQKMDVAILSRLFKLYKIENIPEHIMPMTISWLGNSSVATLPTMFDLLQRGKLNNHHLNSGDIVVFASVGAGMHINSMVYKMH